MSFCKVIYFDVGKTYKFNALIVLVVHLNAILISEKGFST